METTGSDQVVNRENKIFKLAGTLYMINSLLEDAFMDLSMQGTIGKDRPEQSYKICVGIINSYLSDIIKNNEELDLNEEFYFKVSRSNETILPILAALPKTDIAEEARFVFLEMLKDDQDALDDGL